MSTPRGGSHFRRLVDPFTIAALGIGAGGALYGAIKGSTEMDEKKEEWLRRQQELAQRTAAGSGRMADFWSNGGSDPFDARSIDAAYLKRDNQRYADETFKTDPASFLPFVQNATQLAGGLYDAGKGSGKVELPEPNALAAYDYGPQGNPMERGAGGQGGYGAAYGYDEDPLKLNHWGRLA